MDKPITNFGFTMIELLVTISIIGILVAISIVGLQGARESARDTRRKSDLEEIRSALELYKADCGHYPTDSEVDLILGSRLVGDVDNPSPSCSDENIYDPSLPSDPAPPRQYLYIRAASTIEYELCASLEQGSGSITCGGSNDCGGGSTCNYRVTSP
jgi:type II secretion system protein G